MASAPNDDKVARQRALEASFGSRLRRLAYDPKGFEAACKDAPEEELHAMFLKFVAEDMDLRAQQQRGELPKGPNEERQFLSFMMETLSRENVRRGGKSFLPWSLEASNLGRSIEDVVADKQTQTFFERLDYEISVEIALEGVIGQELFRKLKTQISWDAEIDAAIAKDWTAGELAWSIMIDVARSICPEDPEIMLQIRAAAMLEADCTEIPRVRKQLVAAAAKLSKNGTLIQRKICRKYIEELVSNGYEFLEAKVDFVDLNKSAVPKASLEIDEARPADMVDGTDERAATTVPRHVPNRQRIGNNDDHHVLSGESKAESAVPDGSKGGDGRDHGTLDDSYQPEVVDDSTLRAPSGQTRAPKENSITVSSRRTNGPLPPSSTKPNDSRPARVPYVLGAMFLGLAVSLVMLMSSNISQTKNSPASIAASIKQPAWTEQQGTKIRRFLDGEISDQGLVKPNSNQQVYDVTTGQYHDLDSWCGFIQDENGNYRYVNNCNENRSEYDSQDAEIAEIPEPSFSCSEARTSIETVICSDKTLAALDAELAAAYYNQKGKSNAVGSERLLREQRDWLSQRTGICDLPDYVDADSAGRLKAAHCLITLYQQRIRQLGGQL